MEKPKTLRRMLNKKRLKKKKKNRISKANLQKALKLKRGTTRKSQRWIVRMKKLKSWQQWVCL